LRKYTAKRQTEISWLEKVHALKVHALKVKELTVNALKVHALKVHCCRVATLQREISHFVGGTRTTTQHETRLSCSKSPRRMF
jgi:hypothetical protein